MKKIHFVGLGGSGISGVFKLAEKFGFEVSGCDSDPQSAYLSGLTGHDTKHVDNADLVVTSPALLFQDKENPEISYAKKQGKLVTWQEFLAKYLQKDKTVICVAGTHGKSTTTAMLGKVLTDAGFDPLVMIGANVPEWGGNSRYGKGKYFVTEADEFNNNFLNYHPEIIILNNIEFDHPDFFSSEKDVLESFDKFVRNLVGKKTLIANRDSHNVQKLLKGIPTNINVITYSLKDSNLEFKLKVSGKHNISNALGVIALGEILNLDNKKVVQSLSSFTGIERRSQLIGEPVGIKVYDDYAHHPTAIATTLEGLRSLYTENKIVAIIEPHGFSRTKATLALYKDVFKSVNKVFIGPIYKARDKETFGISNKDIVKSSNHNDIVSFDDFEDAKDNLINDLTTGDVVVVMGAGKSYLWAREIKDELESASFKKITTFRTGGKIKHFFEVKNVKAVAAAVKFTNQNNLPIFIIGGGTDILVSDKLFPGSVIKFTGEKYQIKENGVVVAEAGLNWDKLVEFCVEKGFSGIECLSGIPGTVGAAPVQNIGAYGQELKNTFVSLEAYDVVHEKLVKFNREDCDFGYRESIFKNEDYWQKYIILKVTLKLSKKVKEVARYESLKKYLVTDKPSLYEVRNAVLKVRSEKLEDPKTVGNAGSFFKNPIIDIKIKEKLESSYSGIKIYPFGEKYKVSAGWLIEQAGWKGRTFKTAGVSPKHSLILINADGHAKSQDIYELSELIIADVYKKFGVKLQREVQLINF